MSDTFTHSPMALLVMDVQEGIVTRFAQSGDFLIATSGVVLSTLREAADKDYELTVLSDGCVDADEEVQQVLLSKVFPRQAEARSRHVRKGEDVRETAQGSAKHISRRASLHLPLWM